MLLRARGTIRLNKYSMSTATLQSRPHTQRVPLAEIPSVSFDEFRDCILQSVSEGGRVAALFGKPQGDGVELFAVVTHSADGTIAVFSTHVGDSYPSLTSDCPQVHWFEREIAEQWGVVPIGHPWLKPIRFHASYRPGHDAWSRAMGDKILCSVTD